MNTNCINYSRVIFILFPIVSFGYPFLKVGENGLEVIDLQIDAPDKFDENFERTSANPSYGDNQRGYIDLPDLFGNEEVTESAFQGHNNTSYLEKQIIKEASDVEENKVDEEDFENNEDNEWEKPKNELTDFPLGTPDEDKNVPGEPLTPEDFQNAENIEDLSPPMDEGSSDPIEAAGLFEGDISGVNLSEVFDQRNAIMNLHLRWPGGVIPYVISAQFNGNERSVIAAAFMDYHQYTCIRFVPRTRQRDYVHLLKGAGCSSGVGRSGGGQVVSLGAGCLYRGVVVHELMHAAGFWHEQSRQDRDDHITVLWQNIQPGLEFNFRKISGRVQQTLGVPYDADSVMHYGMYAFSKSHRLPTIISKKPGVQFVGQRRGFSQTDLVKVNTLYECRRRPVSPDPIPTPPAPKPEAGCADNNRHCDRWAERGDCKRNPAWMLVNCARSCGRCGERCGDYNHHCDRWARLGQCARNADYMTVYCARACRLCGAGASDDSTTCEDRNQHCKAWASTGQCRDNPSYMTRLCKKACRQC